MKLLKIFVLLAFFGTALTACEDEPDTVGESVDQAIEDTGDAMDEAGDEIEDAAE